MSVYAFTGAAGTGKTKRLVEKLEGRLQEAALLPEQRVVALTRMHGSRFRMIERLAFVSEFTEEVKKSGLVQRAIERAGDRGIRVATLDNRIPQK